VYASLPFDVVRNIITEGYHADYRRLHITGGEPLLWESLFEALDHALDTGYQKITLNTNGSLLSRHAARKLAAYDELSISISLEGPEVLHDRTRGAGSYRQAVRGIENALEADMDLAIFSVAGKSLLEILLYFAHTVYETFPGIQYLTLIQLITTSRPGFDLQHELLTPEDFLELVQTVCILNLCGLHTRLKNSPLARLVSRQIGIPWVPPTYPLHRPGSLIVMADGNINLSHSGRKGLGKYAPGMIQSVLSSEEYRQAVAPDAITCPTCRHRKICIQYGMQRPSEANKDLHPEVPYCKRVLDLKPEPYIISNGNKKEITGSGEIQVSRCQ
jgi:MoaA/NifB/PqqE/SkfB family radical SAM enzyme